VRQLKPGYASSLTFPPQKGLTEVQTFADLDQLVEDVSNKPARTGCMVVVDVEHRELRFEFAGGHPRYERKGGDATILFSFDVVVTAKADPQHRLEGVVEQVATLIDRKGLASPRHPNSGHPHGELINPLTDRGSQKTTLQRTCEPSGCGSLPEAAFDLVDSLPARNRKGGNGPPIARGQARID